MPMYHLRDGAKQTNPKHGTNLVAIGKGPTLEEYYKIARGMLNSQMLKPTCKHRFHFIIDKDDALVIWFVQHTFHQKRMCFTAAMELLDNLERSGFILEKLN